MEDNKTIKEEMSAQAYEPASDESADLYESGSGTDAESENRDYDTPEKEFEAYPDVYADILNALIYEGEQFVQPERLQSAETETHYQDESGNLRRQYEDLAKYATDEEGRQLLCLVSNQTNIDSKMLLRKCGYVGGCYRSQYNGQSTDICPVMEIVLYWGKKRWRTNRTMKALFRKKKLDKRSWRYIDDEKLHVFEMRHLPKETIELFKSDMRLVLEYLQDPYRALELDQEIEHPEALFRLLSVLSNDKRYVQMIKRWQKNDELKKRGGKMKMCVLMDEMDRRWNEGRSEGRAEGLIQACKDFNASFENTLEKLKSVLLMSETDAQKYMKIYW